jgi:hypothetical protein
MMETSLVVLFLLFYIPSTPAQWSSYPACAQHCMSNAQLSSGCPLNNVCLCSNTGNFFGKASACALQECDTADFDNAYSTLIFNCNNYGQAVDYSLLEFEYAGAELLSTSKGTRSKRTVSNISNTSVYVSSFVVTPAASQSTSQPTTPPTSHLTENSELISSTVYVPVLYHSFSKTQLNEFRTTSDPTSIPTTPQESATSINTPSNTTTASHTQTTLNPPSTASVTQETSSGATTPSLESSSAMTPASSTVPAPTTTNIPTSSTSVSASLPTPSNIPPSNIALCNDPLWIPSPENWVNASVDYELQQRASQWGNGVKFTDFIGNYTGNRNIQCGIGYTSTCTVPDCPGMGSCQSNTLWVLLMNVRTAFQSEGGERWAYFVSISLVEMNTLLNIVNVEPLTKLKPNYCTEDHIGRHFFGDNRLKSSYHFDGQRLLPMAEPRISYQKSSALDRSSTICCTFFHSSLLCP